jgi:Zn-dependent protease with chaperone function
VTLDGVPDALHLHQIDTVTDESHGGNLAVPGPADREHFFAAQARNRRATWRLTALAVLGVLLMGVPMSVVISPLLYAAFFVLNDVVNLVVPTPNLLYLAAHLDQNPAWTGLLEFTRNALVVAALVLPGSLAMLLAWVGARALFLRAGAEGILRALGAREPRAADLEEHQLRNLVAEMAIAGGVKPPRVLLLAGAAANAAAVGSSPDDATIIVSRRLLDELDREQTQAIIGHLVGAVGNGDLRTALVMLSMYRAFGLVMTALGAAFGRSSRWTLLRLVRRGWRSPTSSSDSSSAAEPPPVNGRAGP